MCTDGIIFGTWKVDWAAHLNYTLLQAHKNKTGPHSRAERREGDQTLPAPATAPVSTPPAVGFACKVGTLPLPSLPPSLPLPPWHLGPILLSFSLLGPFLLVYLVPRILQPIPEIMWRICSF